MSVRPVTGEPRHPALVEHARERQGSLQNRMADRITQFAGSMAFVYWHVLWFVVWITLRVEKFPFGLLTMIVSLEAIFLSTFVLISQNRADEKRVILAERFTITQEPSTSGHWPSVSEATCEPSNRCSRRSEERCRVCTTSPPLTVASSSSRPHAVRLKAYSEE